MADLSQFESEQRRLAILQILAEDDDYALNEDIINRALAALSLDASAARLHSDLRHLESHALLSIEVKGQDLYVATLNQLGMDVAGGRERAPGVARPKPGR